MSDIAITKTGIQKSASEFHDDYILYRLEYDSFSCPFCGIALMAKAIYIEGPQGKSPHFSCFKNKPHINGCDGFPLLDGQSTKSSSKKNKLTIGKEDFYFPEKLVPRRNTSGDKESPKETQRDKELRPEDEVRKKRERCGREVGKARYTSALIRSFAASYKAIVSTCFKYAKENKLGNQERNELIKNSLSQAPIELDGFSTTYQVAFKSTKYFSNYSRIWNGTGELLIKQDQIYVKSNILCLYKENEQEVELPVYLKIQIPESLDDEPAYHRTTINRLINARRSEKSVKWFAYGKLQPHVEEEYISLEINNLDYIFIEKSK